MRFSKTINLANASIGKVEFRRVKGVTRGIIEIRASLTADIAITLGIYHAVYLENGAPREALPDSQVWKSACGAFHAIRQPKGLNQSLEIDGRMISDIKIEPSGKKNTGLRVSMKLHYAGSDTVLLEGFSYWLQVGEAPGSLKIVPSTEKQSSIPGTEAPPLEAFNNGKAKKARVH